MSLFKVRTVILKSWMMKVTSWCAVSAKQMPWHKPNTPVAFYNSISTQTGCNTDFIPHNPSPQFSYRLCSSWLRHGNEGFDSKSASHREFSQGQQKVEEACGMAFSVCVFVCVHKLGEHITLQISKRRDTHTQAGEPPLPQYFWASFQFYVSSSPPSARHTEHSTMATYVPTGRAGDAAAALLSLTHMHMHMNAHAHTHTTVWLAWHGPHGNLSVSACLCLCIHPGSDKPFQYDVTLQKKDYQWGKQTHTHTQARTHAHTHTSLHTPSFTRWDLFYRAATVMSTENNTSVTLLQFCVSL